MALKLRSKKGQVLLELVIVMAVLVLLLVALVSLVILSLSTIQKSRLRARATAIAQDGLENVRLERERYEQWEDFEDTCCSGVGAIETCAGYSGIVGGFTPSAACLVITPTPAGPEKAIVNTSVDWEFGGKSYNVDLQTEFGPKQEGIFR